MHPDLTWLEDRLAPLGAEEVRPLAGGASSLTYSARVDGRRVVVKVAPPGLPPVLNRDVLRQARVLRALHGTDVPVPDVVWEDAGDPPDVPPLFVMSFVEGTSLEPLFDPDGEEQPAVVAERMRNAAMTLAALHALDPATVGLGAEPVVALDAEIGRWCRLLETVDPILVPGWQDVASKLRETEPPATAAVVVHGDFRLGNLLAVGPAISAVVDWEIWTVGDPRIDIGWFLANADPATYRRRTRYTDALPSPAQLVEVYANAVGGEVPDITWFQALACFKTTSTWSLIVKHNRRRPEPAPAVEAMATVLPHLLARARTRNVRAIGPRKGHSNLDRVGVMPTTTLTVERPDDGIALVRLNRPERLNAINEVLLGELKQACVDIALDPDTRAVVLTGTGRGFCSGIDLRDFGPSMLDATDPAIDRLRFQESMASLPQAIRALPQPVVAAVNGPAVGGGFALCLASDIRICSTSASFGNAAVLIGLSGAEMGMSYFLPRIVGLSVAADWMLTGRTVSRGRGVRARVGERVGRRRPAARARRRTGGPHRDELAARRPDDEASVAGQHRRARSVRRDGAGEPQPGHHARHRRSRQRARAVVET